MTGLTECQPEADELRDYVVRRGGGFYRPRAQGYTQSIGEAGRWTRADASLYAVNCEGVTVHHVSEFPPDTIATLQARVDELTKALKATREELIKVRDASPEIRNHELETNQVIAQAWHTLNDTGVATPLEGRGGAT